MKYVPVPKLISRRTRLGPRPRKLRADVALFCLRRCQAVIYRESINDEYEAKEERRYWRASASIPGKSPQFRGERGISNARYFRAPSSVCAPSPVLPLYANTRSTRAYRIWNKFEPSRVFRKFVLSQVSHFKSNRFFLRRTDFGCNIERRLLLTWCKFCGRFFEFLLLTLCAAMGAVFCVYWN